MSHDPDAPYRCLKCGATSALLLPERVTHTSHVTLKCLECGHIQQVPRRQVEGAGSPRDSNDSLE
jgi:RNase P subunit RPR2